MNDDNVIDIGAASADPKRSGAAMLRDLARAVEEGRLAGVAVATVHVDADGKHDIGHGIAPCCDKPNLAMLLAAVTLVQRDVVSMFE